MEFSSLPKQKWWGDDYLYQVGGFWLLPQFIQSTSRVVNHFKPVPSDIILASFPKTGTTWLKSLIFAIVNRSSKHRLATEHPHELVPTLEVQVALSNISEPLERVASSWASIVLEPGKNPDGKPKNNISEPLMLNTPCPSVGCRIFSTHIPYQLLSETLDSSECRVIYITRNPKDTIISTWHFVNKWNKANDEPWPLDVAVNNFCRGIIPCGPYYEHVMGYEKLSLERPENLYFITYEELMNDTKTHVQKLAEFLGCPFEGEDEDEQVLEVVKRCSFDELSNHEVNKSEESPTWFPLPYNSFFRKGEVGDHRNYLSDEAIERIDALTKEKFHSTGFMYGL